MSTKRLSPEEKLQLIIESFKGDVSVTELCRRLDLWPTEFHRLRTKARQGALEALKNSRHRKKDFEKDELRAQIERLKGIIVTQAAEIELLKKRPTRIIRSPRRLTAGRGDETGVDPGGGSFPAHC